MTKSVARALRLPLRELLDRLAEPVGMSAQDALGVPVAVDLRFVQHADGIFVSGVPADLVDLVAAAAGASVDAAVEVATVWMVATDSRGVSPHVVGTGPAGFARSGDGAPVALVARGRTAVPALEQAQRLRLALRAAASRISAGVGIAPDVETFARLCEAQPDYTALAFEDVAASRELLGHFLVDAGDRFDDERLDQLGDGYLNLAPAWAALVDEPPTLEGILGAERDHAELMSNAAEQPTRYAF